MEQDGDDLNDFSDFSETDEEVQEEPEIIEEEPKEVNPEYKETDLVTLVDYVKKMTILQDLKDDDWNNVCESIIRQWIMDVNLVFLFVFYDKQNLTVDFTFPTIPVNDVMYFMRDPQLMFTLDTFHDDVTFGRIQDDVDGTLLTLIEKVYAPVFFGKTDWSENVKTEFSKALNFFLANMTALHHKMSGLVVLYIPSEALSLRADEAVNDEELMKRLDLIAEHWVSVLRVGLNDTDQIAPCDLISPIDEYNFWIYRSEIIYGIQNQTSQEDFVHILRILEKGQSTFLKKIHELIDEANLEFERITDNILYLRLLLKPCVEINGLESPSEIATKLPKLINIIRFIWLQSKYYNTKELITILFRYVSNHIIAFCQMKIDVESLLINSPDAAIKIANTSIDCCLYYKVIYELISSEHKTNEPIWDLDNSKIFNHIDTFIRRLYNLIEISEGIIVFGGNQDENKMSKLPFGGDGAENFEITRNEVECQFKNALDIVLEASDDILNVNATEWETQFRTYNSVIERLEGIVHNLITNVFLKVVNVEEGIEALSCFHIYSRREKLRSAYIGQVSNVWKMFGQEITTTNDQLIFKTSGRLTKLPKYAARAIFIKINRDRIIWLHSLFTNSEWLPENPHSGKILAQYEQLKAAMTQNIQKIYDEWLHSLGIEIGLKLNRTLMIRSTSLPGLFQCNIDQKLFNIFDEADYFKALGFGFPVHINQFLTKRNTIKVNYDSILKVIANYNKILMSLSDKERLLFRPLIEVCDIAILPGAYKLTWASEVIEAFIVDCTKHIRELQEFLEVYRKVNANVVETCEKISCVALVSITVKGVVSLEDVTQNVISFRNEKIFEMINYYNSVCEMLFLVYDALEIYSEEVLDEWTEYIKKLDKLMEHALLMSARDSLKLILARVHGDGSVGPSPLINVTVDLHQKRLNITPSMRNIADFFGNINQLVLDAISLLPRFFVKFNLNIPSGVLEFYRVTENDSEFREIQKSIVHEVMLNQREMYSYIEEWSPFISLWQLDKKIFMENFKKENAAAGIFDKNIERLTDISNQILFREVKTTVYFMIVHSKKLKQTLLEQIEIWKMKYLDLLEERALNIITEFYKNLNTNMELIAKVPENVAEMQSCLAVYDEISSEVARMEQQICEIKDFLEILFKHNVRIDGELIDMQEALDDRWANYLEKLVEAKQMLNNARDSFKLSV